VVIPILVGVVVWNLNDASNVAQLVSVPLAAVSTAVLLLSPSRGGSPSREASPISTSGEAHPARHRSRARTIAEGFAVVFLAVAVANLATGTFLSINRSHDHGIDICAKFLGHARSPPGADANLT
jgi:hypothetical protein